MLVLPYLIGAMFIAMGAVLLLLWFVLGIGVLMFIGVGCAGLEVLSL
jgi:hypothetical protein